MTTYYVLPPKVRYIACTYNGKPRVGLELGDDSRTNKNLLVATLDGYRTFRKDAMMSVRDVTTLEVV